MKSLLSLRAPVEQRPVNVRGHDDSANWSKMSLHLFAHFLEIQFM